MSERDAKFFPLSDAVEPFRSEVREEAVQGALHAFQSVFWQGEEDPALEARFWVGVLSRLGLAVPLDREPALQAQAAERVFAANHERLSAVEIADALVDVLETQSPQDAAEDVKQDMVEWAEGMQVDMAGRRLPSATRDALLSRLERWQA